jgi:hypothetical protein
MINRTLAALAVIVAPGLVSPVIAADLPNYGCTVLMCLANPNGSKAASFCVPFINQLYHDLSHSKGFPSCSGGNGSYAQQVNDPYDPCPIPLKVALPGTYLVQGKPHPNVPGSKAPSGLYDAVGNPQISEQSTETGMLGQRACVGKFNGSYSVGSPDDGYTVNVYDKVVWQAPQSPMGIDVYVDNKFYRRVRQ